MADLPADMQMADLQTGLTDMQIGQTAKPTDPSTQTASVAAPGRIIINVGGTRFETTIANLRMIPYFATILERWNEGEIWVDRDPRGFAAVLNSVRDPSVGIYPDWASDAAYYGVQTVVESDLDTSTWQFIANRGEPTGRRASNHVCFKSFPATYPKPPQHYVVYYGDAEISHVVFKTARRGVIGEYFSEHIEMIRALQHSTAREMLQTIRAKYAGLNVVPVPALTSIIAYEDVVVEIDFTGEVWGVDIGTVPVHGATFCVVDGRNATVYLNRNITTGQDVVAQSHLAEIWANMQSFPQCELPLTQRPIALPEVRSYGLYVMRDD